MKNLNKPISLVTAFILFITCLPGCNNPAASQNKDEFLSDQSMSKYISKAYSVNYIEGGIKLEKFVFETTAKSKMVWSGTVHFANMDITKSGAVEIKLLKGKIDKFQISPENKDYKASISNGVLKMNININDKIWVEINGDKLQPLMLFGNPPKPAVPQDAIYFPAGIHNIGRAYKVKPNTTLYLDEGAYLIGSIDARGSENVKIMGRGIISGEYKSGAEVMAETNNSANWELFQEYFTIRGDARQTGFVLDGVSIINTPCYNAYYVNEFRNVKIISPWVYTSDGFHAMPTKDKPGIVKDSYAFVADDVFYASYNQYGNVEITNCFASSTNNNIFLIGYWGWGMKNNYKATVKDIYVKPFVEHAIFQAVIDGATSETGFKDMTFENIYIEGNIICPLIWIQNRYYPWPEQQKNKMLGNAKNIVFKNISVSGRQLKTSKLLGLNSSNGLQDITLENISINGTKVTKANLNEYFDTNEFVTNLNIK